MLSSGGSRGTSKGPSEGPTMLSIYDFIKGIKYSEQHLGRFGGSEQRNNNPSHIKTKIR